VFEYEREKESGFEERSTESKLSYVFPVFVFPPLQVFALRERERVGKRGKYAREVMFSLLFYGCQSEGIGIARVFLYCVLHRVVECKLLGRRCF